MFVLSATIFFTTCLQVIFAEMLSPGCRKPPEGLSVRIFDCCKIPHLFDPEDYEKCGFKKPKEEDGPQIDFDGMPECSKQLCLLEKYGLAKDDGMDLGAASAFLDAYVEDHPEWEAAVEVSKERCLKYLDGLPSVCLAIRQVFCLSATLLDQCATWDYKTYGCRIIKEHVDNCKATFKKLSS